MELATGILSRSEYLRAVGCAVELLRTVGVNEVAVAYGFGCDCPDEQLYQDMPMPLDRLVPFMKESEAAGYYRIGEHDLHVNDEAGRIEFRFCHESDIHGTSDDVELLERLREVWSGAGFSAMHRKRDDGDWEPVA